jgi:L-methionine (R)-S-oxide reductase
MDPKSYLSQVGLEADERAVGSAQKLLWEALDEAKKQSLPATPTALNMLYQFRVPRLSADGSCSLHGELDPKPYDLTSAFGARTLQTSVCLLTLRALITALRRELELDWLGIYQVRGLASGRALVKLAYGGTVSRAEFPLTEAFAEKSNNAWVAMHGKARHIVDLKAHVAAGGVYYECDPKVQSELCLPVLRDDGSVVGIIDAESANPGHFSSQRLAAVVALALEVPTHLPD